MPAPYGVLTTGFNTKTLDEIKASIETYQKANIHPLWDVSTASAVGQINGIIASQLRELWEIAQECYNSFDPDAAIEAAMVQLSLLTGTKRLDATFSTVTCTVNVDAGTYPPGSLVGSVADNPDARFENRDEIVSLGGNEAGEIFVAQTAGPVEAPNGELNVIAEAYVGFNSIVNTNDATLGTDIESITALRVRREEELQASGSTNVDAIRDNVDQVDGVVSAEVLENVTLVTDANGLPGKSFEVVLFDGTPTPAAADADIAQAIWDAKPTGIRSYGSSSENAVGKDGQNHLMYFTRVVVKTVYLEFDVTGTPDVAAIKAALVAYGAANYKPDVDVVLAKLDAIVAADEGVTDHTATRAGFSASPVGTVNLSIGVREVAYLATANILINGA